VLEYALHPSRVPVAPADCVGPDGTFGSSCVGRHGASLDRYLSFTRYYSEPERRKILVPGVIDAEYDPLALHRSYLLNDHGGDELSRLLYLDAKTFLPCLNLSYTDEMGMARPSRSVYRSSMTNSSPSQRGFRPT
jgi:hypothetical protein